MRMTVYCSDWEYYIPFRIAYRTITHSQTITVELEDRGVRGRGEAYGVPYLGETTQTIREQLLNVSSYVERGVTRAEILELLPPGGARNALDCALWDIEAKRVDRRVWDILHLKDIRPVHSTYTIGLDTPDAMAAVAQAVPYKRLKLKLGGEEDYERVALVRSVRSDAEILVDANQAWSEEQLAYLAPKLAQLGVSLIEQPLPIGADASLSSLCSPIPLCADESCQTVDSLPQLLGKYQYINIKLDKTGGLTEALRLAYAALQLEFKLMVGCMGGSSLSMAPAFVVAQLCELADLDSPLLIRSDVSCPIRYAGDRIEPFQALLWG